VVYRGKPLTSGAAAFWKVQVWDQAGQPSDWSAPAQWSMGLLRPADWQAKWIGRDEPGAAVDHRLAARLLRKEFQVPNPSAGATVYYRPGPLRVYTLNGAKVGDHVLSPGLTDVTTNTFLYVALRFSPKQIARAAKPFGLIARQRPLSAPPRLQASFTRTRRPPKILGLDVAVYQTAQPLPGRMAFPTKPGKLA